MRSLGHLELGSLRGEHLLLRQTAFIATHRTKGIRPHALAEGTCDPYKYPGVPKSTNRVSALSAMKFAALLVSVVSALAVRASDVIITDVVAPHITYPTEGLEFAPGATLNVTWYDSPLMMCIARC